MRATTVARNYAEALFELGERNGNTDRYAELIDAVAGAVETTPEVQSVLMSPRVPKAEKARLLALDRGTGVAVPRLALAVTAVVVAVAGVALVAVLSPR